MLAVLVDGEPRRREIGIGEGAQRDGDHARHGVELIGDGRAALGAEPVGDAPAAVADAHEGLGLAAERDLRLRPRAWAAKALPVRRWQARQWQTETRTGSPSQLARTAPQRHSARRVTTV